MVARSRTLSPSTLTMQSPTLKMLIFFRGTVPNAILLNLPAQRNDLNLIVAHIQNASASRRLPRSISRASPSDCRHLPHRLLGAYLQLQRYRHLASGRRRHYFSAGASTVMSSPPPLPPLIITVTYYLINRAPVTSGGRESLPSQQTVSVFKLRRNGSSVCRHQHFDIGGNSANTTNANLTGAVTSTGNAIILAFLQQILPH